MKKNAKKALALVLALAMIFAVALTGCSSSGSNDNKDNKPASSANIDSKDNNADSKDNASTEVEHPKNLVLCSGPIGGPWYSAATKIAEIMMREWGDMTVTVVEGGSETNLVAVDEGIDAQIGLTSSLIMQQSRDGSGTVGECANATAVMPIVSSYIQTGVLASSNIHTWEDLIGKDVSAGQVGFASEIVFRTILDTYGITYDDIKAGGGSYSYLSWSEYPTMVADGHLDAFCLNGEIPHNLFNQIEVNNPVRILTIDEEHKNAVLEQLPALFTQKFPAGCYEGTTEEVEVFGYSGLLIANGDLSDEFLIALINLLQEHVDEVTNELAFVDLMGWENALSGMDESFCRPAVWAELQEKAK